MDLLPIGRKYLIFLREYNKASRGEGYYMPLRYIPQLRLLSGAIKGDLMQVWRLVAHHEQSERALKKMQGVGRIAIGWSEIGDYPL